MDLKVIIDDEIYTLNVPDEIIRGAEDFFARMDRDMDQGWQMSRDWVPNPDRVQRIQIVGDRLLTALENENHDLGRMMAAYILSRAPDIETLDLDTEGEIQNTEVNFRGQGESALSFASAHDTRPSMPNPELRAEAENQVSTVFKMGRQYSFSVMNQETGNWETVTVSGDQAEAERVRTEALKQRYDALAARH